VSGNQVSILGPGGYPKAPYASFAGKPGTTKPVVSVLGPGGYPRPPYGSFAGKSAAMVRDDWICLARRRGRWH
jgi:hypothetical protein